MVTVQGLTVGEARAKIFSSLVITAGEIKRGVLSSRMCISPATFSHEMRDYLDQYPNIKYDKKTRVFSYEA